MTEKYIKLDEALKLVDEYTARIQLHFLNVDMEVIHPEELRTALKQLPAIDVEKGGIRRKKRDNWIPVRKRLPKDDTEVLVTVFFIGLDRRLSNGMTEHYKPNTYIEIASQIDGEWSSESDEDKIAPARHIVTAWMPLPKPYKDGIQPILTEKIVFCKDCKHFSDGDCTELPKIVSENDFCSFGERKESDENENHY